MPHKFEPTTFGRADFAPASFEAPQAPPEIAYTGDPEIDCATELTTLKSAFQERAEAESRRRKKATETGYWVCLCFQTKEQADAFALATAGVPDRFADGVSIARKLGIPLPVDTVPFGRPARIDRKFADLSLPK